jgi:hypothetical protein
MTRGQGGVAVLAVVTAWAILHVMFVKTFLVHDSWIHLFPALFSITREISCSRGPQWLSMVDTGSPHLIHVVSSSITHLVRVPWLYLMGCFQIDVTPAAYWYKAQIFVSYLLFGLGTFILGRRLFQARASAVYLLAATLFAGLCLDSSHSDQVVSILFWAPWIALGMILYHQHRGTRAGSWCLTAMVLLVSVQALDQYPHFIGLAVLTAIVIYLGMERRAALAALSADLRRVKPAALIVAIAAITIFQLLAVKAAIVGYRPSFRADLIVDPATFGETGFAQPTALIGSILPLGMLASHEKLAAGLGAWLAAHGAAGGRRLFMYRYDVLFFHVGVVPTLLVVVSFMSTRARRIRAGWVGFCALMFLVALQQSGSYWLLHAVPFFNVFRSYGLYLCFAAWAFLVASAFGCDALMTSSPDERRVLVRRATRVMMVGGLAAMGAFLGLVHLAPGSIQLLREGLDDVAIDVVLFTGSLWGLRALSRHASGTALAVGVLLLGVVTQAVYTTGVYRILGTPVDRMIASMGLRPEDRVPLSPDSLRPDEFRRNECTLFTQCYLSVRPSASLRLDLEGSFLRSRDSVIHHPGIEPAAVKALLGITHPVYWASQEVRTYDDVAEVVRALNAAGDRVGELLRRVTFVRAGALAPPASGEPGTSGAEFVALERGTDRSRIAYRSAGPFYLNASVTYDEGWRASVDGRPVRVYRGNFDGLLIEAPAGQHIVEFRYFSWTDGLFFTTRLVQLAAGVVATIGLAVWGARRSLETA